MEPTVDSQAAGTTSAGTAVADAPDVAEALLPGTTAEPLRPPLAPLAQDDPALFVGPPRKGAVGTIKKLVLFSDGTGNSAAKAAKTNVWRMFQALDLTTSDQLAKYDDGVGTSTNKYLAAIGGAFGWGLKRNVIDLYKFVCRNYVDGTTEIYGFGFSRGAFTIRVLMGLICEKGLVCFTSEDELDERARNAYNQFRRDCFKPPLLSPVYVYRHLRDMLAAAVGRRPRRAPFFDPDSQPVARIKFLGLWDTVSAYGMPVAELKPAINWLFWPMNFTDQMLSKKIERACHALSLDDERTTFHPIVWDESNEEDQRRITQVWFAGVHANVGGGYPDDQLSLVSLDWMMRQAQANGLRLQQGCAERISDEKSPFGRIYDPRAGLGVFYRYSPRDVEIPCDKSCGVLPIIHGSVIARMARGGDGYAPNSLPKNFLVLAPDGQLLPMEGYPSQSTIDYIEAASPAEPQILAADIADERTIELKKAILELDRPDPASVNVIRNTVWWRRAAYLASSVLAALIVLFPWLAFTVHATLREAAKSKDLSSWAGALPFLCKKIVQWDKEFRGIVSLVTDTVSAFAPPPLEFWVAPIASYPVEFGIVGLLFMLSLRGGDYLRRRLKDFGRLAWRPELREPFRRALVGAERKRIRSTARLLLVFNALFLGFSLAFYGQPDDPMKPLRLSAFLLDALAIARIGWHRRFIGILRTGDPDFVSGMATQWFANVLRHSRFLTGLNRAIGHYCVPALFGLALVYLALVVVNKGAFEVAGATGAICQGSIPGGDGGRVRGLANATSEFRTDSLCWPSGLRLERKTRYRIIIDDAKGNWFDRRTPTDPRGFPANNLVHALATPLKRWSGQPWFAPIAHVGIKGNEEYPLNPCVYRRRDALPRHATEIIAYPDRIDDAEADRLKGRYPTPEERKVLVAEFTTQSGGELFLFVNDAVLAIPGRAGYFYRNNRGTASVKVEQVHNDGTSTYHTYCPK